MRSTTGSANTTNPDLSPAPRLEEATPPRSPRARRGPTRARRRRGQREGGPAGFGGGLASARDRRRVLERNAAERDRVERALADAPAFDFALDRDLDLDLDRALDRDGGVEARKPNRGRPALAPSTPVSRRLRTTPTPTPTPAPTGTPTPTPAGSAHCPVCASPKLASDEVFAAGNVMRLVECLNCDHRFTARPRARWSDLGARMTRSRVAVTA